MFDVCYHRKETNIEAHQERRRFKVDAHFYLAGHGVRQDRRLIAALSLRGGTSLCLTSLEPATVTVAGKNEIMEARKEATQITSSRV